MRMVLTATVTPQVTQQLVLVDNAVRRQQYVASFRRWASLASKHGFGLTVVENSGEDLNRLAQLAWNEIPSFVQLLRAPEPEPTFAAKGKGAVEGQMLDFAVSNLPHNGDLEMLYKCTGRLYVPNFYAAAIADNKGSCFVVEIPRHRSNWFDSRIFGATRDVWESQLLGLGRCVDDPHGVNLEHILAGLAIKLSEGNDISVWNFRAKPVFRGQSGTTGRTYDDAKSRLKTFLWGPADTFRRRWLPSLGTGWLMSSGAGAKNE